MAQYYYPRFHKDAKGLFNDKASILSIKGGTDAYLLEDEVNEMQWIQNEIRRTLIANMTNSGCLQIDWFKDEDIPGSLEFLGTQKVNSFGLRGFDAVLNGNIQTISNDINNMTITLPEPSPIRGITRYDLVYLEFWEKEINYRDTVKYRGGVDNNGISYSIMNPDMNGLETSTRIQFQWRIRVKDDVDVNTYPNGFVDVHGNYNPMNFAQGPNANETQYNFEPTKDYGLFRAGYGNAIDKKTIGTVDGYVYATPLFVIKRMNSAGYHAIDNPDGSNNYIDSTSIPENNGRFSNVIYDDQVTDLRYLSYLNPEQYKDIFLTKKEFQEFKDDLDQTVRESLKDLIDAFGELDDFVRNDIKPDLDKKAYIDDVNALISALDKKIEQDIKVSLEKLEIEINKSNDKIFQILTSLQDHEKRLQKIEEFLIEVGFNTELEDYLNYGLNMRRRLVELSGGLLQKNQNNEDVIVSPGVILDVPFKEHVEYVCTHCLYGNSQGKVGEVWFNKADGAFLVKNTGEPNFYAMIYDFRADNKTVKKGVGTFAGHGTQGVKIDGHIIEPHTYVQVSQLDSKCGEVGDIIVEAVSDGFIVKNTGSAGNNFEWILIDTQRLRNVEVIEIDLDGTVSQTVHIPGPFGERYDVLLSSIMEPIDNAGSVGEIYIEKSYNNFALTTTGTTKAKIRCIVFKEVKATFR